MSAYPVCLERMRSFSPGEISTLVNKSVILQHASDAAFLWTQHATAVNGPHYKLKHLARLDGRLHAHLCGLHVAGTDGWQVAHAALAQLEPGAMFVASYLAFINLDGRQMYRMLQLALTDHALERALLSALSWIEPSFLRSPLERLCSSQVPAHRRIGLASKIAHRLDADAELERAVRDPDPQIRALGFKAIGETKRKEMRVTAEMGLRDVDPICRFWASWSLALHGDTAAAVGTYKYGSVLPSVKRYALEVALRCGESNWARAIVRTLAASPATRREAIEAVGIFGDPDTVPWLLDQFDNPEHARIAGEAFSKITAVDLKYLDLTAEPPDNDVETNAEDSALRWPNSDAVRGWWVQHRGGFLESARYIGGQPVSAAAASHILRDGYQRQRAGAALEFAYLTDSGVFPIGGRADWQRRWLPK